MFEEFENQTWAASDSTVTIANNTDTSIDGSSKKITWTDTDEAYVTFAFDQVIVSGWEEISFHIYLSGSLSSDNIFKMTIDGTDFNFSRSDFRPSKWNHILIDCSEMDPIEEITITALVEDLVLFIDYLGVRKVTYNCDVDIIEALKDHITLDYDVDTTLSADADAGDESISLTSKAYITDTSILELDDGNGTTEEVELVDRNGELKEALENSFSGGDEVRVLCPVRSEEYDELEPDPICGIQVFDISADRREDIEILKNGVKVKEYLGNLGVLVYIDCSHKKKLLQLAREYNRKYGNEFRFLLDGETVDIYMESSLFSPDMIGNNPRMAYYYRVEPQPYLLASNVERVTDTVTVESTTTE